MQALAVENLFVELPQSLKDYNSATVASLMMPIGFYEYTLESETALAEVGAGMHVLSGKQRCYAEFRREELNEATAGVKAKVAALEASPSVLEMHGAGTTNPSKLFWEAMDLMQCRSKKPLVLTYRAVGSSTGQKEFVGASNDFQATCTRARS